MPRTFHDLNDADQRAYRVWESYLNDRTRTPAEHSTARQKMDELLWKGPNAQVLELKAQMEAEITLLREALHRQEIQLEVLRKDQRIIASDLAPLLAGPARAASATRPRVTSGLHPVPSPYVGEPVTAPPALSVYPPHPDADETDPATDAPCCDASNCEGCWVEDGAAQTPPDAPEAKADPIVDPPAEKPADGEPVVVKRKRGRPKGSKNKPKPAPIVAPTVPEHMEPPADPTPAPMPPDPLADLL